MLGSYIRTAAPKRHRSIFGGSRISVMRSPLAEAAENLVQIEQYAELSLLDHDRILTALKARDVDAARDAMRRHLERYWKIMGWPEALER